MNLRRKMDVAGLNTHLQGAQIFQTGYLRQEQVRRNQMKFHVV